jgi:hypothetical protein
LCEQAFILAANSDVTLQHLHAKHMQAKRDFSGDQFQVKLDFKLGTLGNWLSSYDELSHVVKLCCEVVPNTRIVQTQQAPHSGRGFSEAPYTQSSPLYSQRARWQPYRALRSGISLLPVCDIF